MCVCRGAASVSTLVVLDGRDPIICISLPSVASTGQQGVWRADPELVLLGRGVHRPGEVSTRESDLVALTGPAKDCMVLGRLPEGRGPLWSLEGFQRQR